MRRAWAECSHKRGISVPGLAASAVLSLFEEAYTHSTTSRLSRPSAHPSHYYARVQKEALLFEWIGVHALKEA